MVKSFLLHLFDFIQRTNYTLDKLMTTFEIYAKRMVGATEAWGDKVMNKTKQRKSTNGQLNNI